jgi:predicted nucleic-acid-binding protein
MIAFDANVLVRYLVQDDPGQAALASRLIEDVSTPAEPGFVSLVVLAEIAWVLGRVYGCEMSRISRIVSELAASDTIQVEAPAVVTAALRRPHETLADSLIHEVGRAHGCTWTATFDRRFARLEGVRPLA